MSDNSLILTVGLPRSGKTTWARSTGYPMVNPDSIRLAICGQRFYGPAEPFVWAIAYTMVDALFKAGHETVVVDATNNTAKRRAEWFNRFGSVKLKFFHTLPQECAERARQAGDLEIIPVIERMAAESDWESSGAILLDQIE
jgi:predicted kinase